MSSSATSKPFFHCAPYWAYCPVSGPVTPIRIGSLLCASAGKGAASAVVIKPRNSRRRNLSIGGSKSDRTRDRQNGALANAPNGFFDCAYPKDVARQCVRQQGIARGARWGRKTQPIRISAAAPRYLVDRHPPVGAGGGIDAPARAWDNCAVDRHVFSHAKARPRSVRCARQAASSSAFQPVQNTPTIPVRLVPC